MLIAVGEGEAICLYGDRDDFLPLFEIRRKVNLPCLYKIPYTNDTTASTIFSAEEMISPP